MTYISRRTRIIVPRWLDESDSQFRVKRTRSDGRLKRNSSCDDLRAWVNNNCIRHDYLVDLMSSGETAGNANVHLFGRYVPVPDLINILLNQPVKKSQSGKISELKIGLTASEKQLKSEENISKRTLTSEEYLKNEEIRKNAEYKKSGEPQNNEDNPSLQRIRSEKSLLEKRVVDFARLLCQAVKQLEKIGYIVAMANTEVENARNEEIRAAFAKSSHSCSCSCRRKRSNCSSTKGFTAKPKNIGKCSEILRKISCLLQKLERVEKCRQDLSKQIEKYELRMGTPKMHQVTELYIRDQSQAMLEKKLERLTEEKKCIVMEMLNALSILNNIKKSSKSNMAFNDGFYDESGKTEQYFAYDNFASSESERTESGSPCNSSQDDLRINTSQGQDQDYQSFSRTNNFSNAVNVRNTDSGKTYVASTGRPVISKPTNSLPKLQKYRLNSASAPGFSKLDEFSKDQRRSKIKFICQDPPFDKRSTNTVTLPNSFSKSQILRETTGPVVRSPSKGSNIIRDKTKSETEMKEIEKALRNYDQRLRNVESLEFKVEQLKQKVLEGQKLKQRWQKRKEEDRRVQESSFKEIQRLCSANWELRRQVQELSAKLETAKCNALKVKDIHREAELLRKELSEYQNGFENQRICISKLEGVVAEQRTEIEKLMNDIRKLTKVSPNPAEERKNLQKYRFYSSDWIKPKENLRRPRTEGTKMRGEIEETCNCFLYDRQEDLRRRNQTVCCYNSVPCKRMQ